MSKKAIVFLLVVIALVIVYAYFYKAPAPQDNENPITITNFEECVAAGNPVMESYPRQCGVGDKTFTEIINTTMTEAEARLIAEQTCIKGGEALTSGGIYNANSKTWWFDANLNSTQQGCNPACVVSEETKTAEINWRCTGLIPFGESAGETLRQLFAQKYPIYAETLSIRIEKETENHARGTITFVDGEPGGIFLAAKIGGQWQIVFDGNGQIPCALSSYGFPADMLSDCAE
ncbi:MAG: hypothetical protein A2174_03795 [Candidatus Portnoybacteria bacterium RBG_13_41_18]|uniref:Uncharacterized protein n=1 Tax=Candidatus Portnoybacteria bacterium RBG_13_41_18 TaxID=1801991 RepID=A0A1G2F9Q6_9BACT|nr:MAG: hypothetical protein A2174_03795 [Candidatus Portnoybacteria bacterium RBG_13_41_18]